jgi:hypothetical protein
MEKSQGRKNKQGYNIKIATQFPGALFAELEKMAEKHRMKVGPIVAGLALRGLLEYRKDGRLGTPEELCGITVDAHLSAER